MRQAVDYRSMLPVSPSVRFVTPGAGRARVRRGLSIMALSQPRPPHPRHELEPAIESAAAPDQPVARRRLRLQDRTGRAGRPAQAQRAARAVPRPAGRHRDRRRCRRLPAQRRAGDRRHHRFLHADRRRSLRLRPDRRHQCAVRRLRDGRQADPGAGPGRHADQRVAARDHRGGAQGRRGGLRRGGHSRRGWPFDRLGRADLRAGRAGPGASVAHQAQRGRAPATCWCSASRWASACCRPR